MIDLAPPAILAPSPNLWTPAKPFIIRASEEGHDAVKAMPFLAAIAGGARRNSSSPTITAEYVGSNSSSANITTYDLGDFTMPFDGLMIVLVGSPNSGARTLSSVSIGGTNGTIHDSTAGNQNCSGIASRAVSSGARNVTVTLSGASARCAVFVWAIKDYQSATPHDTAATNSAATTSMTCTLDYPVNGIGFYMAANGGSATISWSAVSEDAQFTTETRFAAGQKSIPAGATANVETASWTSNNGSFVGGTWA